MLLELAVVGLFGGLIVYVTIAAITKSASALQQSLLKPGAVTLEDFESLKPPTQPSLFDPATKTLSIVIPAYNEQDRLPATLDETISYLQQRRNRQGPHFTYEIIIVDDGSKDSTVRVASSYVTKYGFDAVRVLRVLKNTGKGHAVKRGMQCTRGELLLLMDADGATRVSDLEALEAALSKVQKQGQDSPPTPLGVAFGSRSHLERGFMAQRSALRNFLTRGFHVCVMLVAGGRVRDTQCGFKLFTRKAASLLFCNQRLQRWCFDVELLLLAEQFDIPVAEVPVQWTEMPGSKIRPTSIIDMAWELLVVKVAYHVLGLWRVYSGPELEQLARS